MNSELRNEVQNLIDSHREDDWWDFKQEHHHDKATLVHDIICMANNRANRDAYIIFGVVDKTYKIIGVENDSQRKTQQQIVDILRSVGFAGEVRPRVELQTVQIESHELDVLIIRNSSDVPYYITKPYCDKKLKSQEGKGYEKTVYPYHIYTRVMDNNTEINKSADIKDVEYLWKKRFGMLDTPLQHIQKLLQNPDEWVEEDGIFYHSLFPQYTLKNIPDDNQNESNPEIYHYTQMDKRASYGKTFLFHYTTEIFSWHSSFLDGGRTLTLCPQKGTIRFENSFDSDLLFRFRYFLKNSLQYDLTKFFQKRYDEYSSNSATEAVEKMLKVVMLFQDQQSLDQFIDFVVNNRKLYEKRKREDGSIYILPQMCEKDVKEMTDAYILKGMQQDWEKSIMEKQGVTAGLEC